MALLVASLRWCGACAAGGSNHVPSRPWFGRMVCGKGQQNCRRHSQSQAWTRRRATCRRVVVEKRSPRPCARSKSVVSTAGRRSFERRHDQHLSACDHDRRGVKRHARRRPRPPPGPAAACGVHGVTFTASPKRLVLVLAQDSTRNLDPDLRDFFCEAGSTNAAPLLVRLFDLG